MSVTRLYRNWIRVSVLVWLTLCLASRALGAASPPAPGLRGFSEGCDDSPLPCWNGIVPGKTTAEGTYQRLSELGYDIDDAIFGNTRQLQARLSDRDGCGQITANIDQRIGVLYELYVRACAIPPGAFLSTYGRPTVANLEHEPCSLRLLFMEGQMQVTVSETTRLHHPIIGFGLLSAETVEYDLNRDPVRLPWSGTLPIWKYKSRFASRFECT
jgi:hypothetical protein